MPGVRSKAWNASVQPAAANGMRTICRTQPFQRGNLPEFHRDPWIGVGGSTIVLEMNRIDRNFVVYQI